VTASIDTAEFDKTIRARLQTLGSLAATIAKNPRGTLVPTSDEPPHSGKNALEALRRIQHDPNALRVHETLGEGGMGIVHLGHQVTLDRRVAVKTLRKEHLCDENIESLLGEAWLAGSLEHPNVVPIYDLGLDASGAPLLVMKRIEGDTWSTLLADPETMKRHAGSVDALEFNLRVLIQVCNAIHFAHSREVIHRDLKPDNVMIGHFGEVYVLDWGVATRPGPARHVAGTLVYMAPEMLGGGAAITARTDVYLLGAVLHEILTGKAPHDGPHMQAMVTSVVLSTPSISGDVPEELASLVRACMSREPAGRPESALEVRRAVELFLEHRGAIALAAQAEQKLEELEGLLAAADVEIERAYNVFGECRFGFRQALRAWKDAEVAKSGMARAVAAMVRFEAANGDARAAQLLLGELDEKNPELEALVEAARKRADEEAKRIEKLKVLEKDLDPREGRSLRLLAGLAFAGFWTIVPLVAPLWVRTHPTDEGLGSIPACLVCVVAMGLGHLRWPTQTRINRQLFAAFAFGVAMQPVIMLALRYGAHLVGPGIIVVLCAYWMVVMGVITVAIERRLASLPIAYAISAAVAYHFPNYRYDAVAVSNFVAVLTVIVIWSRKGTELAIARDKRREERGTAC
jgi:serine/threonine-protein kinase